MRDFDIFSILIIVAAFLAVMIVDDPLARNAADFDSAPILTGADLMTTIFDEKTRRLESAGFQVRSKY